MKVKIRTIAPEEEEYAVLHTNRQDASLERLKHYIESEDYDTVEIQAGKNDEICFVISSDVCYIESVQDIQYIHTQEDIYTSRMRLYAFLDSLPRWFVRASRSTIINLRQIKRYIPLSGGLMQAEFSNGEYTYISRKYVGEIRRFLKEAKIR